MKFFAAAVLAFASSDASVDACDEFSKIVDGVCADDCLDAMIGICPQALVVKIR